MSDTSDTSSIDDKRTPTSTSEYMGGRTRISTVLWENDIFSSNVTRNMQRANYRNK